MKKIFIFILPMLLLASCSNTSNSNGDTYTLYYFENDNRDSLIAVNEKLASDTPADVVRDIFSKLSKSDDKELVPILPSNIELSDLSITDGICNIGLSSQYLKLSDSSTVFVDACLVKSICSLSYIDSVVISCEDVTKEYRDADFITDTPITHYDTHTVNLYFANADFDSLEKETETLALSPDTTLEYTVVSRLFEGPASENIQSAIPADTHLNNVYVSDGVCIIDLSSEFVSNVIHDELHEGIALYSIVNTVTELPMINSVRFLIDGNVGYGYTYYDIQNPLTNDSNLFN